MESLGHKFKLIDKMFKFRVEQKFKNLDITFSQAGVLSYMERHPDIKITQKHLCEQFNVKHSTMAGILQRMAEKNLITIVVDEKNKKYKNIYRTKQAELIQEEMERHRNYTEQVVLKGFTKEETETLHLYLDRVFHNLLNDTNLDDYKGIKKNCFKKECKEECE